MGREKTVFAKRVKRSTPAEMQKRNIIAVYSFISTATSFHAATSTVQNRSPQEKNDAEMKSF